MEPVVVVAVVVVLVVVLVVWVVSTQKRLVNADELCGNALSQIGVQQASRWDALTALADLTKSYSEHEHRTLLATIAARQDVGPATSVAEAGQQESMLTQAFGRIDALACTLSACPEPVPPFGPQTASVLLG